MDEQLVMPYINSTLSITRQMTAIELHQDAEPSAHEGMLISYGVTSLLSFSGKMKGRFVIDLSPSLAIEIAKRLLGGDSYTVRDRMVVACVSELGNIISGDANTALNNRFQLGLRLAPPIVFSGKDASISAAHIESVTTPFSSEWGPLKINIGFTK